jgi:hypothetical protein
VLEQLGVLAASVKEGVNKDGKAGRVEVAAWEEAFVIGGLGEYAYAPIILIEYGEGQTR